MEVKKCTLYGVIEKDKEKTIFPIAKTNTREIDLITTNLRRKEHFIDKTKDYFSLIDEVEDVLVKYCSCGHNELDLLFSDQRYILNSDKLIEKIRFYLNLDSRMSVLDVSELKSKYIREQIELLKNEHNKDYGYTDGYINSITKKLYKDYELLRELTLYLEKRIGEDYLDYFKRDKIKAKKYEYLVYYKRMVSTMLEKKYVKKNVIKSNCFSR